MERSVHPSYIQISERQRATSGAVEVHARTSVSSPTLRNCERGQTAARSPAQLQELLALAEDASRLVDFLNLWRQMLASTTLVEAGHAAPR